MSSDTEKQWQDRDWLYEKYHEENLSQAEMADLCEGTKNGIQYWMKKHEIPRRSLSEANADGNIEKLHDKEWLRREYVEKERSGCDIAEQLGVHNDAIYDWLEKHGFDSRTRSEAMSEGDVEKLADSEWLEQQYVENQRHGTDIANECDVDPMSVYSWLEKHDIEIRDVGQAKTKGKLTLVRDEEWLREQYVENERGMLDIARAVGVEKSTVRKYIDAADFDSRPDPMELSNADFERLNDPDYLREQHHEKSISVPELAETLNTDHTTVYRRMRQFGIERRGHEFGHPVGSEHPQHKPRKTDNYGPNWPEQRLKARIRDQCRCQVCSKSDRKHINEHGRVNHVHHIKPRERYIDENGVFDYAAANRLSNLITLCESHHPQLEGIPIDNRHL